MHVFLRNSDLVESVVPVPSFMLVRFYTIFVIVDKVDERLGLRSHLI